MKFKLWYYTGKFGVFLFPMSGLIFFTGEEHEIIRIIGEISLITLIILCVIGVGMGFFLAAGKLKMKCPFCDKYGLIGGNRKEGLWMECDKCGFIHGTGTFGLKLKSEPVEKK